MCPIKRILLLKSNIRSFWCFLLYTISDSYTMVFLTKNKVYFFPRQFFPFNGYMLPQIHIIDYRLRPVLGK